MASHPKPKPTKPKPKVSATERGRRFGRWVWFKLLRLRIFRRLKIAEAGLSVLQDSLSWCVNCGAIVLTSHEQTVTLDAYDQHGNRFVACKFCAPQAKRQIKKRDRDTSRADRRKRRAAAQSKALASAGGQPN